MVTTISGPSSAANPASSGASGSSLTAELEVPAGGTRSRTESRRASNQSKELSDMDLPDPSGLEGQSRPLGLAPTANGLLTTSADVDSSPFVNSIPSSPYLGSISPGLGSVPKFGDTAQYDAVVARLEKLNLPDPEGLTEDSKWVEEEKERLSKEMQDILDNMDLPDPEYLVRANMRAEGIKTPEPETQAPGETVKVELARKRTITQKNKNDAGVDKN